MIEFLYCHDCGKCVSTGFKSVPTNTPDTRIIIRAYIQCPECMEKKFAKEKKS